MYNQNQVTNPQNFVKTIVIIHLALFMGQAMFVAVVLFIIQQPFLNLKPGADPLFYLAPALVVVGMAGGSFIFKQLLAKALDKESLKDKLAAYQTALIVRYALSEAPSLFCIVCTLLTHNVYYLIVAGINIVYFIMMRPSKYKMQEDLNLGYEEQAQMEPK